MKKIFLFCFFFYSTFLVNAQNLNAIQQKKVDDIFKKGAVVYFKFPVNSVQEVTPLSKDIKVDKMQGSMVFAHATKDQFSKFIVKNYPYTVLSYGKSTAKAKTTTSKSGKSKPKSTKK